MFELTINGEVYTFKFGMRFVREMNKRVTRKIEGLEDEEQIGLSMYIARVLDQNLDALYDVLFEANAGQTPRLKQTAFDEWIEDENTDIEEVFKVVQGFFEKSNCTKIMFSRVKAEADKLM